MPRDEFVLYIVQNAIDRESSLPTWSNFRPPGWAKRTLTDVEQRRAKRRKHQEQRFGAPVNELHPDAPVRSRENEVAEEAHQQNDGSSENRVDNDGFAIPRKIKKPRARNAASPWVEVHVLDSQTAHNPRHISTRANGSSAANGTPLTPDSATPMQKSSMDPPDSAQRPKPSPAPGTASASKFKLAPPPPPPLQPDNTIADEDPIEDDMLLDGIDEYAQDGLEDEDLIKASQSRSRGRTRSRSVESIPTPEPPQSQAQQLSQSQSAFKALAAERSSTARGQSTTRWTAEEDAALLKGMAAKLTIRKIMSRFDLDRSESAVRNRRRQLRTHSMTRASASAPPSSSPLERRQAQQQVPPALQADSSMDGPPSSSPLERHQTQQQVPPATQADSSMKGPPSSPADGQAQQPTVQPQSSSPVDSSMNGPQSSPPDSQAQQSSVQPQSSSPVDSSTQIDQGALPTVIIPRAERDRVSHIQRNPTGQSTIAFPKDNRKQAERPANIAELDAQYGRRRTRAPQPEPAAQAEVTIISSAEVSSEDGTPSKDFERLNVTAERRSISPYVNVSRAPPSPRPSVQLSQELERSISSTEETQAFQTQDPATTRSQRAIHAQPGRLPSRSSHAARMQEMTKPQPARPAQLQERRDEIGSQQPLLTDAQLRRKAEKELKPPFDEQDVEDHVQQLDYQQRSVRAIAADNHEEIQAIEHKWKVTLNEIAQRKGEPLPHPMSAEHPDGPAVTGDFEEVDEEIPRTHDGTYERSASFGMDEAEGGDEDVPALNEAEGDTTIASMPPPPVSDPQSGDTRASANARSKRHKKRKRTKSSAQRRRESASVSERTTERSKSGAAGPVQPQQQPPQQRSMRSRVSPIGETQNTKYAKQQDAPLDEYTGGLTIAHLDFPPAPKPPQPRVVQRVVLPYPDDVSDSSSSSDDD